MRRGGGEKDSEQPCPTLPSPPCCLPACLPAARRDGWRGPWTTALTSSSRPPPSEGGGGGCCCYASLLSPPLPLPPLPSGGSVATGRPSVASSSTAGSTWGGRGKAVACPPLQPLPSPPIRFPWDVKGADGKPRFPYFTEPSPAYHGLVFWDGERGEGRVASTAYHGLVFWDGERGEGRVASTAYHGLVFFPPFPPFPSPQSSARLAPSRPTSPLASGRASRACASEALSAADGGRKMATYARVSAASAGLVLLVPPPACLPACLPAAASARASPPSTRSCSSRQAGAAATAGAHESPLPPGSHSSAGHRDAAAAPGAPQPERRRPRRVALRAPAGRLRPGRRPRWRMGGGGAHGTVLSLLAPIVQPARSTSACPRTPTTRPRRATCARAHSAPCSTSASREVRRAMGGGGRGRD